MPLMSIQGTGIFPKMKHLGLIVCFQTTPNIFHKNFNVVLSQKSSSKTHMPFCPMASHSSCHIIRYPKAPTLRSPSF